MALERCSCAAHKTFRTDGFRDSPIISVPQRPAFAVKAKRRCCVDLRALKQPFYKLFYSFIYPVKKNEGVKCYLSILTTSFPYSIWNKMHAYTVSCRERLRHFKRCIILIPYWIFYSRALKHNTLTKFVFKPLF